MRFGTDVGAVMREWWKDDYVPNTFVPNYGPEAVASVWVLDNKYSHDWRYPLRYAALNLFVGPHERIAGTAGLDRNVGGKMAFVLRTDLPSREAEHRPDLVEPGDFPWEGAGNYRGYKIGASGLRKESDWRVSCDVGDRFIIVRGDAAAPALEACRNYSKADPPHLKYLMSNWIPGATGQLVPLGPTELNLANLGPGHTGAGGYKGGGGHTID